MLEGHSTEANEDSLLEEIPYKEDGSQEFDEHLRSREYISAPMNGLSERTRTKIITSGWHVPCHCIVARTRGGLSQAFHVQPNKLGPTWLTYEQEQALKELAKQGAFAIAAKGQRSYFGRSDERELKKFGMDLQRVISVETNQWWRLLYDPVADEIWIDDKGNKVLRKYRGFGVKEIGK